MCLQYKDYICEQPEEGLDQDLWRNGIQKELIITIYGITGNRELANTETLLPGDTQG